MTAFEISSLVRRRAELRLGVRITAAGLFSFVLGEALTLPQSYWAVFTAVLVVQTSVGGSFKAALDRLIGTVSGAVYGALVATLVPHNDALTLGTALFVSLAPLAVLASLNASFRVAPVTAVILLLGNTGAAEGPLLAAFFRTVEVTLGGIVGLIVSLVVFPARAHAVMGETAKRVLDLMADLTMRVFEGLNGAHDRPAIQAIHDSIQAAFDKLEAAAQEAERERRTLLSYDSDPDPIPRTLRRAYHDLVLIGRVASEPLPAEARALKTPFDALAEAAARFQRETGRALLRREPAPTLDPFNTALGDLLARSETLSGEGRFVALTFAFEQLQRNLTDLARRTNEFMRGGKNPPK
jgi:uncharacterized membrane protein YccC